MGTVDKAIRIIIALVIAVLAYMKVIEGTLAIVLLVFAVIFVATSLMSFCPLYSFFGFSTEKKK